jgi:hypothetical protein
MPFLTLFNWFNGLALLLQDLDEAVPEPPIGAIHAFCRWLQSTEYATAFRESQYVYPIVEGSHILALGLSVGVVLWFDLRLTGFAMRKHRVSEIFNSVRPWMFAGFAVVCITGAILFYGHAEMCFKSSYFRAKVVLLFLALFNVIIFHSTIDRRRNEWDLDPVPPFRARLAGFSSMVLWGGTIAVGRLMAYNLTN